MWDVRSVGEYECAGAGGCADGTGRPSWEWMPGPVRICWRSRSLSLKQTVLQVRHEILSGPDRSSLDLFMKDISQNYNFLKECKGRM